MYTSLLYHFNIHTCHFAGHEFPNCKLTFDTNGNIHGYTQENYYGYTWISSYILQIVVVLVVVLHVVHVVILVHVVVLVAVFVINYVSVSFHL